MINLRAHPLRCRHCRQIVPNSAGDFLGHKVWGGLGDPTWMICPKDTEQTKHPWLLVENETAEDKKQDLTVLNG